MRVTLRQICFKSIFFDVVLAIRLELGNKDKLKLPVSRPGMLALALASVAEQAMGGSSGAVSKINAVIDGYAEFSFKPFYSNRLCFVVI